MNNKMMEKGLNKDKIVNTKKSLDINNLFN